MKFSKREKELLKQWSNKEKKERMVGAVLTEQEAECGRLLRKAGCTYPEIRDKLNALLDGKTVSHSLIYNHCKANVIVESVIPKCATIKSLLKELRKILNAHEQKKL